MAAIDTSTFLSDLGISTINTAATNQYEFYKGIVWSDASVTNDQYEFYQKLKSDTYRYGFYKTYTNEYLFYTTGSGDGFTDTNIVDFYTFYKFAASAGVSAGTLIDTTGLVVYYKFNDDITDSSGNNFNGQNLSEYAVFAEDYPGSNTSFGKCIDLAGDIGKASSKQDGFDIPTKANGGDLSPLNDFSTSFTATLWLKGVRNLGENGILSIFNGSTGTTPFGIQFLTSSRVRFVRSISTLYTNNITITSGIGTCNYSDGQWHHVAIRFSNAAGTGISAGMKLFYDGISRATSGTTTNNVVVASNVNGPNGWQVGTLNTYSNGTQFYGEWGGKISDFTIWNRALTDDEISTLSNSANGPLIP